MLTLIDRFFPPQASAHQRSVAQRLGGGDIPQFHHHLYTWHCRGPAGHGHVCRTGDRQENGNGHLIGSHGDIALPLRDRQLESVEHRLQYDGVLLPKHVQRDTVRVDP